MPNFKAIGYGVSSFCKCAKRGRKIRRIKRNEETKPILKSHISGTLEAIVLKFGMWSAEVGGHVHSKNRHVSSRHHRATEVRKLHFRSSCQYTHGCCAPASWAAPHDTLPCVLIQIKHTLFSTYKSTKSPTDYSKYATQCNFVRHCVRKAQMNYEESLITNFHAQPKPFYPYQSESNSGART